MKPKIQILITACLCVSFFAITAFSGCDGNEDIYPQKISFTEYSPEGTSCRWKQLSKDSCNYSQVAVINGDEELEKYIDCTNGTYPEIDFSKHTLLLANGVRCYQDFLSYTNLQQISRQKYVLKVDFQISDAAALREWQVAVIVNKLENGSSVTLDGGNEPTGNENYYIAGYDACNVDISNGECKAGGYVFISENLRDTLAAYNVPDNLFAFPAEIMPDNIAGFNLFPTEYRFAYKVQMTYRQMTEEEELQTYCIYQTNLPWLYFFEPTRIVIESISKTQ